MTHQNQETDPTKIAKKTIMPKTSPGPPPHRPLAAREPGNDSNSLPHPLTPKSHKGPRGKPNQATRAGLIQDSLSAHHPPTRTAWLTLYESDQATRTLRP
jgi:hypothetical protein